MNIPQRLVFGSGTRSGHHLLPEVLELGWGNFAVAEVGHLRPHCHPEAYELCFIVSGEVEWATPTSLDVLRERDVYVTQPGEMHWGRDSTMHPCTLYWIILGSPDYGFPWPNLDGCVAALINAELREIHPHRLRGTKKLFGALAEIFEEHSLQAFAPEQNVLRIANARAALHRLLVELVRIREQQKARNEALDAVARLPSPTQTAIEMLHAESHDPHLIREICRAVGMNYRELNEEFIEHLGTTIPQYCLRQRIRLARERLEKSGATIAEVAAEFGFSSSQHFATAFRRITGLTPTECRRSGYSPHQAESASVNTQNLAIR